MVLVFMLLLLIVYPVGGAIVAFCGMTIAKDHYLEFAAGAAAFFALLGYFFVPTHEVDLTRYYIIMQQFEYMQPSYRDIITQNGIFGGAYFIFKWLSVFKNQQLLPALVGFVISFAMFDIITDTFRRYDVPSTTRCFILVVALGMFPFASAYSNVRNVMGGAIVAIAIYRDVVRGKRTPLTIMLYIIGASLHMATVVIIGLRLLLFLQTKKHLSIKVALVIMLGLMFLIPNVRFEFMQIVVKGNEYVNADGQLSTYVTYVTESLFMRLTKLLYFLITIIVTIATVINTKARRNDWNLFSLLLCALTLISFAITLPVYFRLLCVLLIIGSTQFLQILCFTTQPGTLRSAVWRSGILGIALIALVANVITFNQYSPLMTALQNVFTFTLIS